jgi:hypothetical protein
MASYPAKTEFFLSGLHKKLSKVFNPVLQVCSNTSVSRNLGINHQFQYFYV